MGDRKKRKDALFTRDAPNPPPPPAVYHPNCARVQARQDCSTEHQLDAEKLLRYYPHIPDEVMNAPNDSKIEMLHPRRYLPPTGGHFVVGDAERVQAPSRLGSTRCANCFQNLQQNVACKQGQCPNTCGYCGGYHDSKKVSHLAASLNPALLTLRVALSKGLQH